MKNLCDRCNGSGEVTDLLGELTACYDCGGHGWTPAGDDDNLFFFRPAATGRRWTMRIYHVMRDLDEPHRWRVTTYTPHGPAGHVVVDNPMVEVRGCLYSPSSRKLLDYWATKPTWREGLDELEFFVYFSALAKIGLGRLVDRYKSEPYGLQKARALFARYYPGRPVFG